jgi:hypothetical protein
MSAHSYSAIPESELETGPEGAKPISPLAVAKPFIVLGVVVAGLVCAV